MRFKEKASSIALAVILMGSSVISANAYMKEEIVGSNRYETAAKVADKMGNYSTAVLVNGNSIADGLSASGLAGKENAPILLVKTDSIPKETLQRLYKVKKVYIIGKENAVSGKVESSLKKSGISVKRIGGSNRIDTSIAVSKEIGSYSKAFLVNGFKGEADAMSVASVAAREKAPIILTDGVNKPTYKRNGVKYYVIGGNTVMSNSLQNSFSAERLSGSNRYTTNKVIVKKFYPNTDKLYFAKGDNLVDALSVSPLAKDNGLALVSDNSDKSVFYGKEGIIQVGGMNRGIVDKVLNSIYNEDSAKPDENKPENPPEDNKPNEDTQKPSEKTYDINSAEFQKIVRDEFYRLLDAYRASKGVTAITHHWAMEESAMIKSKDMIDNNYYGHEDNLIYPNVYDPSECLYDSSVNSYNITKEVGLSIANTLFTGWVKSPAHEKILVTDYGNTKWGIDGFSFVCKRKDNSNRYDLKATYHSGALAQLKNQPSVELTSIPMDNVRNIVEIFK